MIIFASIALAVLPPDQGVDSHPLGRFELEADQVITLTATPNAAVRSCGFAISGKAERVLVDSPDFPCDYAQTVVWDSHLSGKGGNLRYSALTHCYLPDGIKQISITIYGPASIERLDVIWVSPQTPTTSPGTAASPSTCGNPGRNQGTYPKPGVWSRSSWGADPPQCPPSYCTTTHIGIHHTASASEFFSPSWAECAANVKATQAYHMYTRGWCDLGYNYMVCVHGDIFEGRSGGDDVSGAHDGSNCGSMGVALMGYFHHPHHQIPSTTMLTAMLELAAWKCDQQSIDPHGSEPYSGYGASMENVYGHRDVSNTACPGDNIYALLPSIRDEIAALIESDIIIFDTSSIFTVGIWFTGTMSPDKYGADYLWANSTPSGNDFAWWAPTIPASGNWEISLWWPQGSNRNQQTLLGLRFGGRLFNTNVNQQIEGGKWNILGTLSLPVGARPLIGMSSQGASGSVVVADALRLVRRS